MAVDVFAPPVAPAPGSGWVYSIANRRVEYGDGYSQRVEAVNSRRVEMDLSWPLLNAADALTIETFLRDHVVVPFNYLPPWRPSGTLANWLWTVKDDWQRIEVANLHAEIRVTFRREFDLDV